MNRLDRITDWNAVARQSKFSPRELARLCEISERHLRRYFANVVGKPPQEWLDDLRLKECLDLLVKGQPVKQVADTLYFKDHSHFCHQFKAHYGTSPSRLARRMWATCQDASPFPSVPTE